MATALKSVCSATLHPNGESITATSFSVESSLPLHPTLGLLSPKPDLSFIFCVNQLYPTIYTATLMFVFEVK